MSFKRNALIVALCLLMVPFAAAQSARQTGVIRGTVQEADGKPIPGATVTAKSPAQLGVVTSVTNEEGLFRLLNLSPGIYTITAELAGFKTVKREDIQVNAGQTFTVILGTEMSQLQEEITVVGTPPVVDLQSNKIHQRHHHPAAPEAAPQPGRHPAVPDHGRGRRQHRRLFRKHPRRQLGLHGL